MKKLSTLPSVSDLLAEGYTEVKTSSGQSIYQKIDIKDKPSDGSGTGNAGTEGAGTLKPELKPLTSQQKITYTTSNKKVAVVNAKGKITGKKKGTAVITVKSGKKSVKCKVTVK